MKRKHFILLIIHLLLYHITYAQQHIKTYEFEKDYPVFLDKIKAELDYPLAWGNSLLTNFGEWQDKARQLVYEAMLVPPTKASNSKLEVIAEQQRNGYKAQKILFNLTDYSRVPAYLLIPDGVGPFPAIVMLHDHGAHFTIGKEKVVCPFDVDSLIIKDSEKWINKCYDNQYPGDYLASHGYAVLAIDALLWGERGRKEGARYESQQVISCVFEMLGRSWSGFITYEDLYTIDFLSSLDFINSDKIGCMGFSMGAYRSWMLAALSNKIKASASVYWMTTTDSQLSLQKGKAKGDSNYANVLSGIRRYLDYPHIASLACPKPMLFFNGISDKLFPIEGVEDAYRIMHEVWASQSAEAQLITKLWNTSHICSKEMQEEIVLFFNSILK